MTIKTIQELVKGDHFRIGPHEFIVENVSTKLPNADIIDPEFSDVYLLAKTADGLIEISGFSSEGLTLMVEDDINPSLV